MPLYSLQKLIFMKFNNSSFSPYFPNDDEKEYISTLTHRHDPDLHVEGCLRFYGKPSLESIAIADSNLDFELDLDSGVCDQNLEPNNDFQCDGSPTSERPNEILGLQFIDRLGACDKNYNPLGWQEVQSRMGLDRNFDPIPKSDE